MDKESRPIRDTIHVVEKPKTVRAVSQKHLSPAGFHSIHWQLVSVNSIFKWYWQNMNIFVTRFTAWTCQNEDKLAKCRIKNSQPKTLSTLMVILPQSYGSDRLQETGNTTWSYPAGDGSVPWADEHLHRKDTVPDNAVDCSGPPRCHLIRKMQLQVLFAEKKQTYYTYIYIYCAPDWYLTFASRKTPWGSPGTVLTTISNRVAQCWSWGGGGWPWSGG